MENKFHEDTYDGRWRMTSMIGVYRVSTIATGNVMDTPWPFETVIFRGSLTLSRPIYLIPLATLEEARASHLLIVEALIKGEVPVGGLKEDGMPSMTKEEWDMKPTQ
jgi:hypothetical protein